MKHAQRIDNDHESNEALCFGNIMSSNSDDDDDGDDDKKKM